MRVLMSEKMLEELVSDIEIGIDYNPDVHQEWCDEAHEALGSILAELRSLRAELATTKERLETVTQSGIKLAEKLQAKHNAAAKACLDFEQLRQESGEEIEGLRAEREALKARRVPNLDAMTFQELRLFHMQLDTLDGYQFARRRVLADKVERSIEAEQWYAALPLWAKFREE